MSELDIRVSDLSGADPPAGAIWVDELDLTLMTQTWDAPFKGLATSGQNPISIAGVRFVRGIGTHSVSEFTIDLKGGASRFVAFVGVDDEAGEPGCVEFQVWADDKLVASSGLLRANEPGQLMQVDLTGRNSLLLVVTAGDNGTGRDHADWAGAILYMKPGAAAPVAVEPIMPSTLPIAKRNPNKLRINGPRVVGTTPWRPFLFKIPATGQAPLTFEAINLPDGLTIDSQTGVISGSVKVGGDYRATITLNSPAGSVSRELKIVAGYHKLAQTSPLGWNSWNVWASAIDDGKVRAAADAMVSSGLAAHGYQFINIDDCWEAGRDENGEIQCNEKFPDMKALTDYVHSKGLLIGLYSSPGPLTCGGFTGSFMHEDQDAATWAKWGFDYIKHDWCSYGQVAKDDSLEEFQKPYIRMREALDKIDRDIVYSLCQYGMGEVWKWGESIGANCWRTTGDINDSWDSMAGIGFQQDIVAPYAGPGHWNDPDMMVVGNLGWGPNLHPTRLTQNEQITHLTLWALVASPILLGCDLADMDEWTVDLLTNDEVLDVHQDPMGKAAGRTVIHGELEVWSRPLFDGTVAVGLFNRGRTQETVTVNWEDIGISGTQSVRDLWQQKDMGEFDGSFAADVPSHAAIMIKIGSPQANG